MATDHRKDDLGMQQQRAVVRLVELLPLCADMLVCLAGAGAGAGAGGGAGAGAGAEARDNTQANDWC